MGSLRVDSVAEEEGREGEDPWLRDLSERSRDGQICSLSSEGAGWADAERKGRKESLVRDNSETASTSTSTREAEGGWSEDGLRAMMTVRRVSSSLLRWRCSGYRTQALERNAVD